MAPALEQPFCAGGCGAAAAIDAGSFPEFQETFRNIGLAAELHVSVHNGYLPLAGWQFDPAGGTVNPAGVQDRGERRYDYYLDAGEKRPVPITAALSISLGVNINLDSRDKLAADLQKTPSANSSTAPIRRCHLRAAAWGMDRGGKRLTNGAAMSSMKRCWAGEISRGHFRREPSQE
jgi:hypothetical protein